MYLPKSKYSITVAKPGEFTLDGKPYTGPVITTYLGESYAGEELDKLKGKLKKAIDPGRYITRKAVAGRRIPTESEYQQGFMERYFLQDLRTMKIIELLPEIYEKKQENNIPKYYRFGICTWILKGTLDDRYVGPYLETGIRNRNQAEIDRMERELPGIVSSKVLCNPEEFVRP